MKHPENNISFLAGGGEMGKLTREVDWSETTLGNPETWPQSLRTTLSIILNSKFPLFLFWGEDLVCFYNDAYRQYLGVEGKHPFILGKKGETAWTEIWHIINPLLVQVMSGGESTWTEDQLIPIYRNGKVGDIYWTFSYSPVHDETGEVAGVFVTSNETTQKVIAFAQIEESKRELEFAIEATELGVWDFNPIVNKLTANDRLKEWFGLPIDEEIKLMHAIDVIQESDKKRVTGAISKALQYSSGGNYNIFYTIIHPFSKKKTIVHAKGKTWFNDEKIAYRFNGTLQDITQEAITTQQIKESEQRYHNLIHSSPSAIGVLLGDDYVITTANEPIIKMWGKGNDVIGKKYFEILPELLEQGFKEIFEDVYKTGVAITATETPIYKIQNGKEDLKYYNFAIYAQRNFKNEIVGIGIIATEVTSQALLNNKIKESEQQYRELSTVLEEKVKERTAELYTNNIELQKMNKELQSFAYISSHDLQEPLRKIQTFASLILEKENANLSERGKESFRKMQNAAVRMRVLINDLFAYSRTSTAERKFETTHLKEIIKDVQEELNDQIEEKNAIIETSNLCEVEIIPFQFRQLMLNLISNALKFSRSEIRPVIKINCDIDKGINFENENLNPQTKYCHISVTDNGIGFDPKYAEKIFEVFQRLHTKSAYSGTGIGLSIVKKIVENHGGFISASGELNKGAEFDIYLPAVGVKTEIVKV